MKIKSTKFIPVLALMLGVLLPGCDGTSDEEPRAYLTVSLRSADGSRLPSMDLDIAVSVDSCPDSIPAYPFGIDELTGVITTRGDNNFRHTLWAHTEGVRRCVKLAIGPDRTVQQPPPPVGSVWQPDTVVAFSREIDFRYRPPYDRASVEVILNRE